MAQGDRHTRRPHAAIYALIGIGGLLLLGTVFLVGMKFAEVQATGQASEPVTADNSSNPNPKPSSSQSGVSGKPPPDFSPTTTPTPTTITTIPPQPAPALPPPVQQPEPEPTPETTCPTGGHAFSLVSVEYIPRTSTASPSPYDYFDLTATLEVTNVSTAATHGGIVLSARARPMAWRHFSFESLYLTLQPGEKVTIYDTISLERRDLEPVTSWYLADTDLSSLWDDSRFVFCDEPGYTVTNGEVAPYYTIR